MSKSQMRSITCPKCGETEEFRVWDTINTGESPEMKAQIRDGSLFRFTCSSCGSTLLLMYNFLYHQPEEKFVLFCDAEHSATALMEKTLQDSQDFPGYTKRVVTSYEECREKLFLLDEGLDDRVIEFMKSGIYARLRQSGSGIEDVLFSVNEDGEKAFLLRRRGRSEAVIDFDEKVYNTLCETVIPKLETIAPNDVIIDQLWAMKIARAL